MLTINTKLGFVFFLYALVLMSCKKDKDNLALVADFSADTQEVAEGGEVTFSDISTGVASRWNWTFEGGDPETSDLSSPKVIYRKAGKYKVTLELSNKAGSATATKEGFITVGYNQITADFEADKLTILQDESISFKDLSAGLPTSWQWQFIPGSGATLTSTDQNPTITFTEPGVYTVKLKAANPEFSGEATKAGYITVIDKTSVTADFVSNTTVTYTGGAAISFEDRSLGVATSWSWTFEGGTPATSTEQNPTVTYAVPGRYKVTLVAANTVKSSTREMENYIMVVPGASLAAFFPFNNNTEDIGPDKMGVTVVGNEIKFTSADRRSVTGNAAGFDGSGGLLVASNNVLNLGLNDFSVSCWVKTDKTNRMMIWQESGKNGTGDNQSWLRYGDNTTDRRMRFNTEQSGGGTIVNIGAPADNLPDIMNNQWHHVVCVRAGLKMLVYVDGVEIKTATTTSIRNVTGDQDFKIAFQEGLTSFSNFFTGEIDDFIIYKKALNLVEVQQLFNL